MNLDFALLIIRLAVGLVLAAHGAQKLFGWFGGSGVAKLHAGLSMQGFRPAGLWTALAILSELGGGLALALGFLNPFAAAGASAAMLIAIFTFHWPRFFNTEGGLEFPLVLLLSTIALGIAGPGAYSLDAAFGIALPQPITLISGLALSVVGVIVALATRKQQQVSVAAK